MEAAEGQRTTVGPLSSRGGGRNATSRRPRGEAVGWMGWQDDGPGRMGQDGRMDMTRPGRAVAGVVVAMLHV